MKLKKLFLVILLFYLFACNKDVQTVHIDLDTYQYSGEVYEIVNENVPFFSIDEINEAKHSYEYYADLDELDRVTYAIASIGKDLMPTEKRKDISSVRPTGFNQHFDDELIEGGSLYTRSHLIAFMLTGENANERNLITGTRFMNEDLMLPFEKIVYNYIRFNNNHVLYRVTPHYDDNDLVADYILLEAMSIEDDDISLCVVIYNVEPCFSIDYASGEVIDVDRSCELTQGIDSDIKDNYLVLNTNTLKFHRVGCKNIDDMSDFNRENLYCDESIAINLGFSPCQSCNP